ncbi:hypothetical protein FQA39_LY18583 [Lamprigera yunnana]|nr:hypothetical protein FQA39_LY18583 [Lamprigera yunnana]
MNLFIDVIRNVCYPQCNHLCILTKWNISTRWISPMKAKLKNVFVEHFDNDTLPSNRECGIAINEYFGFKHLSIPALKTAVASEHQRRKKTCDIMWKLRQIGSKSLTFEMIEEKKVFRIEDMCGNEIYLDCESVSEVRSLETVLNYRLSYSSGSNFKHFYEDVIRAVAEMPGDVKIKI